MDDLGFTLQERPWLYARWDMLVLCCGFELWPRQTIKQALYWVVLLHKTRDASAASISNTSLNSRSTGHAQYCCYERNPAYASRRRVILRQFERFNRSYLSKEQTNIVVLRTNSWSITNYLDKWFLRWQFCIKPFIAYLNMGLKTPKLNEN